VTVPTDSERVTEPADRPGAPVAAAVVVLSALLAGAGALAASSVSSYVIVRVLIALALIAAGVWLLRPARDPNHPATLALGAHVLRGIGTSYAVLGANLAGLASLAASIPDPATVGTEAAGPSPTAVILMVYGIPTLALLAVATTGMRAWTAGAGIALPMITALLMAAAGAGATAVSLTMLVVGVVLAVVVVRTPGGSPWGDFASATAAMAVSLAFGAGTSALSTVSAAQLAGPPEAGPAGPLSGAALVVVLVGSLLVAAILLLVAVLRHDLASGLLVGPIFAMPPFLLALGPEPTTGWPVEAIVAMTAVPVVVALVAMTAIRLPRFRDAVVAVLPVAPSTREPEPQAESPSPRPVSGAKATAACAVIVAAAAVVFVVLVFPMLDWNPHVHGAVALVVLAGAGALGYWLPATPGAAAAIVALLGLGLAPPWTRLLSGGWVATTTGSLVLGVLELATAAALAWLLTRRHPRPGVYAAAAYTLAGAIAAVVGAVLFDIDFFGYGDLSSFAELMLVAIVALPLLLLGIAAAVALIRGNVAIGQAVGAVVLALAGFLPLKVIVGRFATEGTSGYVLQSLLIPFTPTDWRQVTTAFREVTGPTAVAILAMVVLGLVLATSLATRASAPLAGAVALLLLAAVQASLLSVLDTGGVEEAELLGQVLGGLAAVVAVVAVATAVSAARRER
jgi:hypothetical protein